MKNDILAERTRAMMLNYESIFNERGGVTPSDPLKFHLYHLALYWARLVGFCEQFPSNPETVIDGDLGACVAVGSEFTNQLIVPDLPVYHLWQEYWKRTQTVLHDRPVTLENVKAASQSFHHCLAELKYDPPWRR
jgi:hypothetical protein